MNVILMVPPERFAERGERLYSIRASGNILGGTFNFLQHGDSFARGDKLTAERAEQFIQRLMEWQDENNLYSLPSDQDFFRFSHAGSGYFAPSKARKKLEEWRAFWGLKNLPGSVHGVAQFADGDLQARAAKAPHQLTAQDFRLLPTSPGKGVGETGRDLGADVDLVGPGAAYQRWKQTPEYQE